MRFCRVLCWHLCHAGNQPSTRYTFVSTTLQAIHFMRFYNFTTTRSSVVYLLMQLRYTHTDTHPKASILNRNGVSNVSVYSMRISRTTIITMLLNFRAKKNMNSRFEIERSLVREKRAQWQNTMADENTHTHTVIYANGSDAKRNERAEKQSQNTQIFSIDTQ